MKTKQLLSTTAIAGTLLLSGLHAPQAKAESNINGSNAVDIIQQVDKQHGNQPDLIRYGQPKDHGDYYEVTTNNKSGVGGAGITRLYKDGTVKHSTDSSGQDFKTFGHYEDTSSHDQSTTQAATQHTEQTQHDTTDQTLPETGQSHTGITTMIGIIALIVGIGFIARRASHQA
ncbi:LPXTG cell wall anchor domain-containing protein [Staphylococcus warneri]|uniref:LPXTG cell wall anchor domain-containing protein n=1 Tax=Staphylococcus warneri TaxID=1292 RepID=UPI000DCBE9F3|nr:LPXTG cell wall anchor domain-containing protein [Staphylococcus warneri]RAV25082.1 cell wall protein [Staphylococcus warneri]RXU45430.1 cell wall protein [Staphylococcus warneri]